MNENLVTLLAVPAGLVLGVFYFGTLWLTVRRLTKSNRPVLLVSGSFVARMAITLTGFYFVFGGYWQRIVACMLGFLLARTLLIRRIGPVGITDRVKGGSDDATDS